MGYKQKTALNYIFNLDMKVRDYECDLQGVVNNANYQHYMEHTRHEFLESLGANFGQMHEDGLDAFVTKVTISYKKSLRSGDSFRSALRCSMRAPKLIFHQDILHLDGTLAARGEVECVVVDHGRLTRGEFFAELLKDVLSPEGK
ncbi:acyl-CoA thioester hydrolase, YbgC/YbaW family [Porphyromonas sp. oral taxon 278 str. W7784]|nr:acyl-CoA thioester hydrolase, YbgC/YbaW family [Porphyromonas sp. oral taxon 278 str. W7784]